MHNSYKQTELSDSLAVEFVWFCGVVPTIMTLSKRMHIQQLSFVEFIL